MNKKTYVMIASLLAAVSCSHTSSEDNQSAVGTFERELSSMPREDADPNDHVLLGSAQALALEEPSQPAGVMFAAEYQNGEMVGMRKDALPPPKLVPLKAPRTEIQNRGVMERGGATPSSSREKIQQRLLNDLQSANRGDTADQNVDVIVTFAERQKVKLPRFPRLDEAQPLDSDFNRETLGRSRKLVKAIKRAREPIQTALTKELSAEHGATVKERFWIVNAMKVELPLSRIEGLAARPDVQHVEYDNSDDPPPHAGNYLVDSRALMRTDLYYQYVPPAYAISLLDTGIRTSHVLLAGYTLGMDCFNGTGPLCMDGPQNPGDCSLLSNGHGTSAAHILTGNDSFGDASRGVTRNGVFSLKVFDWDCELSQTAVLRAFQTAPIFSRVIVANISPRHSHNSAISLAADSAYDAGAVVIAASGNKIYDENGNLVTDALAAPANAHKVLAIGAKDTLTNTYVDSTCRGPTPDKRIKPDVLAPTNVHAAGMSSDTDLKDNFSGTSGAAPHAGGAAALALNYAKYIHDIYGLGKVDAGQIYALLIMAGGHRNINNKYGAGLIQAQESGVSYWWKFGMGTQGGAQIPLYIDYEPAQKIDFAIWWEEDYTQKHVDYDVSLRDNPDGPDIDDSYSSPNGSVFKKLRIPKADAHGGLWYLRIEANSSAPPEDVREVYFALRAI